MRHIAHPSSLVFSLVFCACLSTAAQSYRIDCQVIGSTGGSDATQDMHFAFTVGEAFTATLASPAAKLTQGFHQPECGVPVGVQPSREEVKRGVLVFPNPASQVLNLRFLPPLPGRCSVRVFDLVGQPAAAARLFAAGEAPQVDCSGLPPGSYFLQVAPDGGGAPLAAPFIIVR